MVNKMNVRVVYLVLDDNGKVEFEGNVPEIAQKYGRSKGTLYIALREDGVFMEGKTIVPKETEQEDKTSNIPGSLWKEWDKTTKMLRKACGYERKV